MVARHTGLTRLSHCARPSSSTFRASLFRQSGVRIDKGFQNVRQKRGLVLEVLGCTEHQGPADLRSSLNLGRVAVKGQVEFQALGQKLDAAFKSPVAVVEGPEHGGGVNSSRGEGKGWCLPSHCDCTLDVSFSPGTALQLHCRTGKESCAPRFVVASAPAALANGIAASNVCPSANAQASAPLKASPAAVVSTDRTG